ncbi:MAG: tRNA pseudouridine(38-40) synthase TruA [Bacillaceae bacterium]
MNRLKCTIAYDGTNFSGYQVQQKGRTVQQEVEKALKKLHKGQEIRVHASGRTDAGVHAKGQVIHFDSPLTIPPGGWERGLNTMLPDDIIVIQVESVANDFHSRYDVTKKEYRYFFYTSKRRDIFQRHYAYHFPYPLDEEKIRKAAAKLCGTHDFTSFCSAKSAVENKVRTIYSIELDRQGDEYVFRFVGNGFLYNMVRILVRTLLDVGQGRLQPDDMEIILQKKSRELTTKTAPAHGLYLWQVDYEEM